MSIDWTPGIGDPTPVGWLTVIAYVGTAIAALFAAKRADPQSHPGERRFWHFAALLLFLLAVNKQLDLQTLLTAVGRAEARTQGWYGYRRMIQKEFIYAIAASGMIAAGATAWLIRHTQAMVRLALFGFVFLGGFILIRAASFHHVDALLKDSVLAMHWNWILELSGIGIVAVAALCYPGRSDSRTTPAPEGDGDVPLSR